MVPRALRFIFCGLEMSRCRLCATAALIFPVAVREKRFLAPLLVFILGISSSLFDGFAKRGARHALEPATRSKARFITAPAGHGKGAGAPAPLVQRYSGISPGW